jgi:hypothetical protein
MNAAEFRAPAAFELGGIPSGRDRAEDGKNDV